MCGKGGSCNTLHATASGTVAPSTVWPIWPGAEETSLSSCCKPVIKAESSLRYQGAPFLEASWIERVHLKPLSGWARLRNASASTSLKPLDGPAAAFGVHAGCLNPDTLPEILWRGKEVATQQETHLLKGYFPDLPQNPPPIVCLPSSLMHSILHLKGPIGSMQIMWTCNISTKEIQ